MKCGSRSAPGGTSSTMTGLFVPGGFDRRARRQRVGVDEDAPALEPHPVGGDPLLERRGRAPVLGAVLPPVPRAGDAPVHDLPLPERTPLVGADVRDRRDAP